MESSKAKILVVDDDRLVLATVTHGLTQAGYEVIDADNGDDAILLARQRRPDLALLDIRMEGKTGFDVAAYLRDASHVPFMFLSAFSDADMVAQADALGAVGYLVKPLDVAQLVPQVDAVIARVRSSPAKAPAVALPSAAAKVDDPVPLALGVLMHRHTLSRRDALARLNKLAADQGLTPAAQAERLLAAIEELARTSG